MLHYFDLLWISVQVVQQTHNILTLAIHGLSLNHMTIYVIRLRHKVRKS